MITRQATARPGTYVLLLCLLIAGGLPMTARAADSAAAIYHAPHRAFSMPVDLATFRGAIGMSDQCDHNGGTLNIWDSMGRFFRIDHLKINQHPLAQVPDFASDRTIEELVLNQYLRRVLPAAQHIKAPEVEHEEFLPMRRNDAMLAIVSMEVDQSLLIDKTNANTTYHHGFYIFKKGDYVFIVQHRQENLSIDNMRDTLEGLALGLTIPSMIPPDHEQGWFSRLWGKMRSPFRTAGGHGVNQCG